MHKLDIIDLVTAGQIAQVKHALDKGANVNQQKADGSTALIAAVLRQDERMVALLLREGADIALEDINGNTALTTAEKLNDSRIIKLFQHALDDSRQDILRQSR